MKATQIILFIFLVASVAFTILKWPGQFMLLVLAILGTAVFMMVRSIKEVTKLKSRGTQTNIDSILDSDLNLESEVKTANSLKFVIALTLLLASTYLLCRFQFWRSWIVIQYVALAASMYLGFKFVVSDSRVRRIIIAELNRHWFATMMAFGAIAMAVVPYSTFIHWNEFEREVIPSREGRSTNDPCSGVGRYLWALEREGRFEEIKRFRKEKEGICFFPE